MKTIDELGTICKGGVFFTINEHLSNYEELPEYLERLDEEDFAKESTKNNILSSGQLCTLQFYPSTPIGFYTIHAESLNECLQEAFKVIEEINEKA